MGTRVARKERIGLEFFSGRSLSRYFGTVETGAKKPGLYARCRASPPCWRSVRGAYSYLAERTSQSSPHQPEHELRCVEPLRCRDHRVTPVCDAVPGLRIAIVGSWAPNTGSTAFRPARGDGLRCDRGDIVASGKSNDGGCGGSARHPLPHIEAHYVLWLLAGHGIVCWGPPCGTRQGLLLVDEWVRPTSVLERDEQLVRFMIRYFAGHDR